MTRRTAYQVAEAIQARFVKNDDGEVIACRDTYMSDLLGSDWAPSCAFNVATPEGLRHFYDTVKRVAARKYGELPF